MRHPNKSFDGGWRNHGGFWRAIMSIKYPRNDVMERGILNAEKRSSAAFLIVLNCKANLEWSHCFHHEKHLTYLGLIIINRNNRNIPFLNCLEDYYSALLHHRAGYNIGLDDHFSWKYVISHTLIRQTCKVAREFAAIKKKNFPFVIKSTQANVCWNAKFTQILN